MLESFLAALRTQLENQVVSGGLVLGIVAVIVAALRKLPGMVWSHAKRAFIVTAVIDSRNDLFQAFLAWLNEIPFGRKSRLFAVVQAAPAPGSESSAVGTRPPLAYSPAPGFHLFWYRGRPMWIEREIAMNLQVIETVRVSTLFASRARLEAMLEEVMERAYARLADNTLLYAIDRWGDNWQLAAAKPRRRLDSVVLAGDIRATLEADVQQFFERRAWYADLGIPWRRGYLFHGPPGTGKTSLAIALAGELRLNLCTISLTNPKLNDQNFADLLQRTPSRSLILIEDVDAFFRARAKQDVRMEVSFSGLLNAIDGVAAQEGRIVVMTTNDRTALDAALIRPGRIDIAFELDLATADQIERLFLKFHPGEHSRARALGATLPSMQLSPAAVQQALLAHPDAAQAEAALRAAAASERAPANS